MGWNSTTNQNPILNPSPLDIPWQLALNVLPNETGVVVPQRGVCNVLHFFEASLRVSSSSGEIGSTKFLEVFCFRCNTGGTHRFSAKKLTHPLFQDILNQRKHQWFLLKLQGWNYDQKDKPLHLVQLEIYIVWNVADRSTTHTGWDTKVFHVSSKRHQPYPLPIQSAMAQ